jgi:hypothetical protein
VEFAIRVAPEPGLQLPINLATPELMQTVLYEVTAVLTKRRILSQTSRALSRHEDALTEKALRAGSSASELPAE